MIGPWLVFGFFGVVIGGIIALYIFRRKNKRLIKEALSHPSRWGQQEIADIIEDNLDNPEEAERKMALFIDGEEKALEELRREARDHKEASKKEESKPTTPNKDPPKKKPKKAIKKKK